MGQQQLLLIVLGVIIVGIAVVVGINLFNANAEESAIDTTVSEATNIAAMGLQYYKKPQALGGGGNDFTGFAAIVPATLTNSTYCTHTVTEAPALLTINSVHNDYTFSTTVTVDNAGNYLTTVTR
jgi:hypothetical protein